MRQKLKDAHGETIIEVLVSILVAALSVALLFSALMAASRLNHRAQETDKNFYVNLDKAWRQGSGDEYPSIGTAEVTITPSGGSATTVSVTFYGSDDVFSY